MTMTREQAKTLLALYQPDHLDPADSDLAAALEWSLQDEELRHFRNELAAIDSEMRTALHRIPVPDNLRAKILSTAGDIHSPHVGEVPNPPQSWTRWLHLLPFGVAAALTFSLAIYHTFWHQPQTYNAASQTVATAGIVPNILPFADEFFRNHTPRFRSSDPDKVKAHLSANGGIIASKLPQAICWTQTVACDVIEHNGVIVSLVCFMVDSEHTVHLITLHQNDFPDCGLANKVTWHNLGDSAFAAWTHNDLIYILYSSKGEDNLRSALEI